MNMKRYIAAFKREINHWFLALCITNIPGNLGSIIRSFYWRRRFRKSGSKIRIEPGFYAAGTESISIGDSNSFGLNSYLYALNNGLICIGNHLVTNRNVMVDASQAGEIIIGDDVFIASNVVIRASNHSYFRTDVPMRLQGHEGGKIVIGNDVWIAANAVLVPDVNIGNGSIIAAGCVVTKDVPEFSIFAGIPGRVIGYRINDGKTSELQV